MGSELRSRSIKYVQTRPWQTIESNSVPVILCRNYWTSQIFKTAISVMFCRNLLFCLYFPQSNMIICAFQCLSQHIRCSQLIELMTIIRTSENSTSTNCVTFPMQYNCRDSTRDSLYIRYAI
jgi:hypothetical protein